VKARWLIIAGITSILIVGIVLNREDVAPRREKSSITATPQPAFTQVEPSPTTTVRGDDYLETAVNDGAIVRVADAFVRDWLNVTGGQLAWYTRVSRHVTPEFAEQLHYTVVTNVPYVKIRGTPTIRMSGLYYAEVRFSLESNRNLIVIETYDGDERWRVADVLQEE